MALPTMSEKAVREFLERQTRRRSRRQPASGWPPALSQSGTPTKTAASGFPTELKVAKVANIARDPEVSFCVDDKSPPHKGLVMYCTAEIITEDIYERRQGIMSRYLGDEVGAKIAAEPRPLGIALLRLQPHRTYSYDYSATDQGYSDLEDYR